MRKEREKKRRTACPSLVRRLSCIVEMNLSVVLTLAWLLAILLVYLAIYFVVKYSFIWRLAALDEPHSGQSLMATIIDYEDSDSADIV